MISVQFEYIPETEGIPDVFVYADVNIIHNGPEYQPDLVISHYVALDKDERNWSEELESFGYEKLGLHAEIKRMTLEAYNDIQEEDDREYEREAHECC